MLREKPDPRRQSMRRNLIILTLLASAFTGCKMDPAPPTIDDAKVIWNNLNTRSGLKNKVELVEMKKTDGQMTEVNGVKVYTLYYESREKNLVHMGNQKPGDVETVKSNYGFQKTEQGWQGPDGTIFPN
jgi:hypothetical protein